MKIQGNFFSLDTAGFWKRCKITDLSIELKSSLKKMHLYAMGASGSQDSHWWIGSNRMLNYSPENEQGSSILSETIGMIFLMVVVDHAVLHGQMFLEYKVSKCFQLTVKKFYWAWKIFIFCEILHKYLNENLKIQVISGFSYSRTLVARTRLSRTKGIARTRMSVPAISLYIYS